MLINSISKIALNSDISTLLIGLTLFTEEIFKRKTELGGSIEVICGSMFSGKTEELIRRVKRTQIAHLRVEIFKPQIDRRFHESDIVSHDQHVISATPVESAYSILLLGSLAHVVAVDEAQFFDDQLPEVCNALANKGIRVIVAGLDMDFEGKPFGPMPALMSIAESITKVHAVCVRCGNPALYSYRLVPSKEKILLGEKENYEPRCRSCFHGI